MVELKFFVTTKKKEEKKKGEMTLAYISLVMDDNYTGWLDEVINCGQ